MMDILTNFCEEIPIVVEKREEDPETYIDETYNMIKEREKLEKSKGSLQDDTKRYINCIINDHLNTKTKRENFYEHELIKSYKERIFSLEEQVKRMGEIIFNFSNSTTCKCTQPDMLLKQHDKQKSNEKMRENSIAPEIFDFDTPNQSVIEDNTTAGKSTKDLIDEQLSEVRKINHDNYLKQSPKIAQKNPSYDNKIKNTEIKKTCLVLSDSMFNGIREESLSKEGNKIKIRYFSGAKVCDLKKRLPDVLKNIKPDVIVIHVGTNNAPRMTSNEIVDEILTLKSEIVKIHNACRVIISTPITRTDDGKAALTIRKVNSHFKQLKVEVIDNPNITAQDLGKKGLHLSKKGKSKLSKNLMNILGDETNDQ